MYGAIDLHETENVIRLRDLRSFHIDSNSINLEATVTFFDLETGVSKILQDSIVEFPAAFTHNFVIKNEFKPRGIYRVTADRSDGKSVASSFAMPGVTEAKVLPIIDTGVSCSTDIKIVFKNVMPDEQIRWYAGYRYQKQMYWLELTGRCNRFYDAENRELVITDEPWGILTQFFHPPRVGFGCEGREPDFDCSSLDDGRIYLRYLHLGPEWNKVFPARAADPLEVGDVENGIGFVGGFREDTLSFKVYQ